MMRTWTRNIAAGLTLLLLGGCAAVETYVGERRDLAAGGPEARIQEAQGRQAQARATNTALQRQVAEVQAQQASLSRDLQASQAQLGELNRKLAGTRSATAAQRRDYDRLVARQKQIRQELDALARQPQPVSAIDASAQSLKLQQMQDERDALQRQIDALQQALS
ncbi:hypothetical protein IGS68_25005 [Skermanella sp. TT6]|uniref:Lipoprotein n=1 Tax=Skermanella cutis TaxID=2775420 RepID=A0ABX7B4F7_9PROT|nr:hypothetical protein [Skermanella sp. TT6]QQP89212.1 hypothetical protein IGS68_25005 [Skermanella sp. TT6]